MRLFAHDLFDTSMLNVLTRIKILEPQSHNTCTGWICLLLIVTKLLPLSLSSIAFVKANRADLDDMPYSVEYHLGVLVC